MEEKEKYLEYVKNQIAYYDQKSITEQRKYKICAMIALIANAAIPVLTIFSSTPQPYKQVIALLSAIAAVFNGFEITFHSGSNWKHYRNACQDLRKILRSYYTLQGPFEGKKEKEHLKILYERCEEIFAYDRKNWERKDTQDNV